MSTQDIITNFGLENKLKPNQKLSCAACGSVFEDVISAAEHTINCKIPIMQPKKRKRQRGNEIKNKVLKTSNTFTITNAPNTFTGKTPLYWSERATALLLKCLHKRSHLLGDRHYDDIEIWRDVESEMRKQYSWAYCAICQLKWKKLLEEFEKFQKQTKAESKPPELKPEFYYIIREIHRKIMNGGEIKSEDEENSNLKTEKEDSIHDEELADPDAVEDEPFAGVMDSQGNMHLRDLLLEVVHSLEMDESVSDLVLAERHGVEEAIVEWVRENQDAVVKGCLRCSTCNERILKREEYIEHELECILNTGNVVDNETDKTASVNDPKSIGKGSIWSAKNVAVLINLFKKKAPYYISPQGALRPGLWLEIYKEQKPIIPKLTPLLCSGKWMSLVNNARVYCRKRIASGSKEDLTEKLKKPPFFKEVSDTVDLLNTEDNSPESFIPKELIPDSKRIILLNQKQIILKPAEEEDLKADVEDSRISDDDDEVAQDDLSEDSLDETLTGEDSSDLESDNDDEEISSAKQQQQRGRIVFNGNNLTNDTSLNRRLSSFASFSAPSSSLSRGLSDSEKRMNEMERKMEILIGRLVQLEEENRNLRLTVDTSSSSSTGGAGSLENVVDRLDRLHHIQSRGQMQLTEAMSGMVSMWERHHRENLTAIKALVLEISKRKLESKEKKVKN